MIFAVLVPEELWALDSPDFPGALEKLETGDKKSPYGVAFFANLPT
jgi:hypothetical protein